MVGRTILRGAIVAAMAACFSLTCTACSGTEPTPEPSGPYAEEWALSAEALTSGFERQVFADGRITMEEYDEAHQLWLACMEQEYPPGGTVQVGMRKRTDGLYEYVLSSIKESEQSNFDRWYDTCSAGTIANISGLYNDMTTNPEHLSFPAQLFPCLEEKGVIPDGYAVADFERDFFAYTEDSAHVVVPVPGDSQVVLDCAASLGG